MDGMANFDISAEEEQMLLDMDDQTNSSPSGSYINMTGLMIHGITRYQVTFVIESEYHKILVHC